MTEPADRQRLLDAWLVLCGDDPRFADTLHLPMLSGSMAPRIPVRSQLVIAPPDSRSWGTGDVVVFLRDEQLVAHRVLLILGFGPDARILEKGDCNPLAGWIRRRDVRGLVVDRLPPADAHRIEPLAGPGSVRQNVVCGLRYLARRLLGRVD